MVKTKFCRKKLILAFAVLFFLLLSAQAFGQSASLSGTVTDASQAVLPGATITATNIETGVQTKTSTNNAGIYSFASLPPGNYEMSAEMPGFQTLKRTDVRLTIGSQLHISFEIQVTGIATEVEVSTSAADMLMESGSSTGTIMDDQVAKELPLVGNDLMQLVNIIGGVVKPENPIYGSSTITFAGVMANNINITRDGISVNDVRYSSGITSPSRLNPEMVGEFKLILTPVDAEMGRGAGQVQLLTKSGGNEYHGSAVWSLINTALDANEWDYNRTGTVPLWKNVNQYTISAGGPIIRKKTFFFASWDHNIARKRESTVSKVLTPCARKGIYRYWTGWIPTNADDPISRNYGAQTRPSVNSDGTPLRPTDNWDGTPYTGSFVYQSVLGRLTPEAQAALDADPINCSQYTFGIGSTGVIPGTNWDPYRKEYDKSGYIDKFSDMMPMPNYYLDGDGLNVAALRWTRTTYGEGSILGTGMDEARKSITVKIDHNLNAAHRLSGTYSYERSFSGGNDAPTWPPPKGFGGAVDRKPQTFTASLTSALLPMLLNEFRVGLAYNYNRVLAPIDNPDTGDQLKAVMQEYLPTGSWSDWQGLPVLVAPWSGNFSFNPPESNFYGGLLMPPTTWGSNDYRWTFADTISLTKGTHSLKFGAEVRLTKANSQQNGNTGDAVWFPYVAGGNPTNAMPSGLTAASADWPGLVGIDSGSSSSGTYAAIYDHMNYMAGTVQSVKQYYFVNDASAQNWSDPSTADGRVRHLRMNQREYSFFFKDEWKVNSDLTVNLGVRYEYYGVPWMLDGMTLGVKGGAERIFGGSEGDFDQWLRGVPSFNPDNLTEYQFIGPGSANPDIQLYEKDLNNFGPAVGFAWQIPWFGRGKTTLRGGYQVSYVQISRLDPNNGVMNVAGNQPGLVYPHAYGGDNVSMQYLDLSMMQNLVPTSRFWDGSVQAMATRPLTDGTQSAAVYDPNIRSPYIQSLTLALTRQIGSSLTVDVRYIGTLSRKQVASIDINTNNWVHNGLKEAFDAARRGDESPLLNQLMPPGTYWLDLAGIMQGDWSSLFWSGADQLRTNPFTSTALATGDYKTVANALGTSNGIYQGVPSTVQGELVRRSGLGENFIFTNRQFRYAYVYGNFYNTNYHSLQGQVTLRPTHGLNFQATYTWSRNLGIRGSITDPLDRAADYGILDNHRSHMLTTYGTYNLPLGPEGYVFRNSSGWVKKLVEGWQLSWISNMTSGVPFSVTTVASMPGGATIDLGPGGAAVDLVRPDLFDTKGGHVTWEPGARDGRYWGNMYVQVDDPQCSDVAPILQDACRINLNALALASDPSVIVFQKAQPGVRGNFDPNSITGPGRWSLDMAMSKNIEIKEGKSINFRVDVNNIFNHPTPSGPLVDGVPPWSYDQRTYVLANPVSDLNSTDPFGYIPYKGGHRVFSAKVRINF